MSDQRQLPNDPMTEKAVIGLCLEDGDNYDTAFRSLAGSADIFYQPVHADIFRAMGAVTARRYKVDMLTIREELEKARKWTEGHFEVLADCLESAQLTRMENLESMVFRLADLESKRQVIRLAREAETAAFDSATNGFEVASSLSASLATMSNPTVRNGFVRIGTQVDQVYDKLEADQQALQSGTRHVIGQSTGLMLLDHLLGGDVGGELTTIAARPGGSKSTFVLCSAQAGARQDGEQAIISLEMDNHMQIKRILSNMASISNDKLKQAKITEADWARLHQIRDQVAGLPISLDFSPGLDVVTLEAKCRRAIKEFGVKRIFIDYLQLMDKPKTKQERVAFDNQNMKIQAITMRLKQLAGEWDVPIILLSQMSREIEKRTGKRMPQLSDLRDSGSIEQDSNNVIFIESPSKIEESQEGYCAKWYAAIYPHEIRRLSFAVVAKQRSGATGTIPFWNDRQFMRFSDIKDLTMYKRLGLMEIFDNEPELMERLGWKSLGVQQELWTSTDTNNGKSDKTQDQNQQGNGDYFPF